MTNLEKAQEMSNEYACYDKNLRNSGVAYNVALHVAAWKRDNNIIEVIANEVEGYVLINHESRSVTFDVDGFINRIKQTMKEE